MIRLPGPQSNLAFVRRFRREGGARRPGLGPVRVGLAFVLVLVFGCSAARAQDRSKRKIPVVDKITGGSNRQAFSGKVESLDLERHVLMVNASEGKSLEIFPVKKGVSVSAAGGEKMKLNQLKQGTNVIIYYEQKGDRRTVREIVVLKEADDEKSKKPSAPS